MDSLLDFQGLRTAVENLIGQSWYLLVATFGLTAAAVADFLAGRRRHGDAPERPAPVLGVLLALTGLLLLVSAAAFPERTRPDMLVYGRYTEIVAPALIALGLTGLPRVWLSFGLHRRLNLNHTLDGVRRVAWPLAGFGALTAVVALIRATTSAPDPPNRWNVSALPFVTVQLGPAILIGAALVALAGAGLLWWAGAYGGRAVGSVAVGLFVAVIAYGVWNPVRSSERAVYPPGWESPQAAVERAGAGTIAYDLDHYDTIGLYTVQWFMPKTKVTLFHGNRQSPPSRFVLSDEGWAHRHPGAKPLWSAVGRDETLWEAPRGG